MNEKYLEQLFEKYRVKLIENDIKTTEDLKDYIQDCIKSNLMYDFNMSLNIDFLLGKGYVESDKTPEEIAERLYELAKDMDYEDYEDTKEKDLVELEQAIYTLKLYARNNYSFRLLYDVLDRV